MECVPRTAALPCVHRVSSCVAKRALSALLLPLKADDRGLESLAQSVSDPSSPAYGHYVSYTTLAGRFGASSGVRAQVVGYLIRHGATGISVDPTHTFVFATMSVASAERSFGVRLGRFSAHGAGFVAPTGTVHVPSGLSGLIGGVVGLNTRPVAAAAPLQPRRSTPSQVAPRAQSPTSYS